MKRVFRTLACAGVLMLASATSWGQDVDDVNPLEGVLSDMQVATGRLARFMTDKPTQQKQHDAIDKLDALIKLLEERRRGGGGGGPPTMPAPESTILSGPGGSGPLHAPPRSGANWGQLPAHKREQILQSMTEGFPPNYQSILEGYYRRLADERPVAEVIEESSRPMKAPAAPVPAMPGPTASERKP